LTQIPSSGNERNGTKKIKYFERHWKTDGGIKVAIQKPNHLAWDPKPKCLNCGAPINSGMDFCSKECEENFLGSG
jgi:hypothetical protein